MRYRHEYYHKFKDQYSHKYNHKNKVQNNHKDKHRTYHTDKHINHYKIKPENSHTVFQLPVAKIRKITSTVFLIQGKGTFHPAILNETRSQVFYFFSS